MGKTSSHDWGVCIVVQGEILVVPLDTSINSSKMVLPVISLEYSGDTVLPDVIHRTSFQQQVNSG